MGLALLPCAAVFLSNQALDGVGGDQPGTLLVFAVLGLDWGVDDQGAWGTFTLAWTPDICALFQRIGERISLINVTNPGREESCCRFRSTPTIRRRLLRCHLLVEVDVTKVCSVEEGKGPSWWVVQIKGYLTILPGLAGFATRINLSRVLVERKVEEASIGGEGAGDGASRAPRTGVTISVNVDLTPIWMVSIGWNRACHSAQEDGGQGEQTSAQSVHSEDRCFGYRMWWFEVVRLSGKLLYGLEEYLWGEEKGLHPWGNYQQLYTIHPGLRGVVSHTSLRHCVHELQGRWRIIVSAIPYAPSPQPESSHVHVLSSPKEDPLMNSAGEEILEIPIGATRLQ